MQKTIEMIALESARDELAAALDEAQRTKTALDALQAEFDRQHMALIAQKKAAAEKVEELRVTVRDKAIKAWEIEPVAKLTDGIGMQQRTQVEYDPLTLREALLKYAPMLLQVNDKAVKALGESAATKNPLMEALMPVLPITIYDKPTPTIGDETLIKLHQMNEATRVVDAAFAAPEQAPAPTTKRRAPAPAAVDEAVEAAAAALDALAAG